MSNRDSQVSAKSADWSQVFPSKEKPGDSQPRPVAPKRERGATPVARSNSPLAKLKGLSIRQPWAEQVMQGEKTSEYRQTPVKFRGRIYIYASLGRYPKQEEEGICDEVGFEIAELPRGVVVGTVEIKDCYDNGDGTFTWDLVNPERIEPPVPPLEKPQPIWFHPFGRPDE